MIEGGPRVHLHGKRYMERTAEPAHVHWCTGPNKAWIDGDPRHVGLRFIGKVVSDIRHSWGSRCFSDDLVGWYTNDDGFCDQHGDGLVWGEVHQMTTRHGMVRFVAGYRYGCGDGLFVDFSQIFEEPRNNTPMPQQDIDCVGKAAAHADSMAEEAAEEEREYQRSQLEEEEKTDDA